MACVDQTGGGDVVTWMEQLSAFDRAAVDAAGHCSAVETWQRLSSWRQLGPDAMLEQAATCSEIDASNSSGWKQAQPCIGQFVDGSTWMGGLNNASPDSDTSRRRTSRTAGSASEKMCRSKECRVADNDSVVGDAVAEPARHVECTVAPLNLASSASSPPLSGRPSSGNRRTWVGAHCRVRCGRLI